MTADRPAASKPPVNDRAERRRPVVLCILDGWGDNPETENNAVAQAKTPTWDHLVATCPGAHLETHGPAVGLPEGQFGNSEVGHMNLGAGRVLKQDLARIHDAIMDGSLKAKPVMREFIAKLKASGGACHLMGLVSSGGVHSHYEHVAALAQTITEAGVPVRLHAFLDGRDTPPKSAEEDFIAFLKLTLTLRDFQVATVSGRFYPLDRDNRWERVERAFRAIHDGKGERAPDVLSAIDQGYGAGLTDEFILPTVLNGHQGMEDGDGVLMANFRADRARQLLAAFTEGVFDGFERPRLAKFAARLGMVEYSDVLNESYPALFPAPALENGFGQVVAEAGLTQLRCAETEKYPHVTFFFNGGREEPFPGEERILVPSPRVATYDLQPEMSAPHVTERVTGAIASGRFDVVIINYANGDMVGHTGDLGAAIKAAEAVDAGLGALERAVLDQGGVMLVTADHGNCETMVDPETGGPHTAHTTNLVRVLLVGKAEGVTRLSDGKLADVAPTLLDILGLEQPREMTGRSLFKTPPPKDEPRHASTVAVE